MLGAPGALLDGTGLDGMGWDGTEAPLLPAEGHPMLSDCSPGASPLLEHAVLQGMGFRAEFEADT